MKPNLFIVLLLFLGTAELTAQQVREYTVVVKTATGRYKGIFEEVLRDSIVVSNQEGWQFIPVKDIKVLKVKEYPRKYRRVITVRPPEPERDIYGHSTRTVGEEIGAQLAADLSGSVINGIYSLIYNAFNNLAVFHIDQNAKSYRYQLYRLNTFSVAYQALPLYEKLKMEKIAVGKEKNNTEKSK